MLLYTLYNAFSFVGADSTDTMHTTLNKIIGLAGIFNFFLPISISIDSNCDFHQDMVIDQKYYIYNKQYPLFDPSDTHCRWSGKSPKGSVIILKCDDISLPFSNGCQTDRLSISLTGDPNLQDSLNYCGNRSANLISQSNRVTIGLLLSATSSGGRFVCTLTASPKACDCGWKQSTRIVGGQNTGINEYPSMAALINRSNRGVFCGASIISDRYVLTAAHCLVEKVPGDVWLLVGDWDLTVGNDTAAAALYEIIGFIQHPKYDEETQQNDIAILKTKTIIEFSVAVGPICLPFNYTETAFDEQTVTALGWGYTHFGGHKSDILQAADLSIMENSHCRWYYYSDQNDIIDQQICTYDDDKDACLSDSGGPLIWQDSETRKLQLVGIISYGRGCASDMPAVNTRVTSYLTWIVSATRDAVYCIK